MSLWNSLNHLWDSLVDWFESIGEGILDALKPIAKQIAKSGGMALIKAATDAVYAAEIAGGSGPDKFQTAKDTVIASLKAQGLPIVFNAIHAAIEAAVAQMKEEDDATP